MPENAQSDGAGAARKVSPSEAAEEEPAGGEALLSMLVGSIPFGLLAEDEEKRFLYATKSFAGCLPSSYTERSWSAPTAMRLSEMRVSYSRILGVSSGSQRKN